MKYTKRSLVGLFTLLIMPLGGAQATNNAPYPFGEEFVYHTCPSGFDKDSLSCKIKESVLVKCDNGYVLSAGQRSCSRNITQGVTYSCPTGFQMQGGSCNRTLIERDYSAFYSRGSSYLVDLRNNGYSSIKWKGKRVVKNKKVQQWPYIHSDGWSYTSGRLRDDDVDDDDDIIEYYEVVRKRVDVQSRLSHCSDGYNKVGNACFKKLTKPVVKYCREGTLTNNYCLTIKTALRHSPIEETMATLYPRYSDDAAQQNSAAFRYLDNMFTLDPELGEIVSA
ncbi:hypothetical protein F0233_23595, partial [Vibrio splendidus]|nr:hypothetical protein [Vibrio splendidus]